MERRVAGLLLVAGFASLAVAGSLFTLIMAGSVEFAQLKVTALEIGFLLTALGLAAYEFTLTETGARILARFATIAFVAGAILWTVSEVINIAQGFFTFGLERDYVMLTCVALAAIGGIAFRTGTQPRWFAWLSVVSAFGYSTLYLLRIAPPPLGPNVFLLVLGVLLLRPSRTSS